MINNKYSIEYIKPNQISSLQEDWERLEKGDEMSYFQTYHWNEVITHFFLDDNYFWESRFALVKKEGTCVLIAPLWIIKHTYLFVNKRGVYLLGRTGWSDYLNFIYDQFDGNAINSLLSDLKKRYNVSTFYFEQSQVRTSSYRYFVQEGAIPYYEQNCVALSLPKTEEEYLKMLSKSSRQNLRTANNRLIKDGKDLTFIFDDRYTDRKELELLRESRLHKKNYEPNLWKRFYHYVGRKVKVSFKYYLPFYADNKSKVMTAWENGKLRAFFCYGYDMIHKSIVVMAAGTDEEFARYSPGMLMMFEYIKNEICKGELNVVDFTRGNERYKYALGGSLHLSNHLKLKF